MVIKFTETKFKQTIFNVHEKLFPMSSKSDLISSFYISLLIPATQTATFSDS